MSERPWLSEAAASPQARAQALVRWFEVNGPRGAFSEALEDVEQVLEASAELPASTALELWLLRAALEEGMGFLSRCSESCAQARRYYGEEISASLIAKVEYTELLAALGRNELELCEAPLEALRGLVARTGDLRARFSLSYSEAALAQQRGLHEESLAHLWRSRALSHQLGHADAELVFAAAISRQCVYAGQFTQARRLTQQGASASREVPYYKAHRLLYYGLASAELEEPGQALEALAQSYEVASEASMMLIANHAATYLAWLLLVHRRGEEALGWLSRAALAYPRHPSSGLEDALQFCAERMVAGERLEVEAWRGWSARQVALVGCIAGREDQEVPWPTGSPSSGGEAPDMDWIDALLFKVRPGLWRARAEEARVVFEPAAVTLSVGTKRYDLRRRGALRRLLVGLLEAQHKHLGALDTPSLFELGWPDVERFSDNGMRRVYTELYRLKSMGLELECNERGYLLVTPVEIADAA